MVATGAATSAGDRSERSRRCFIERSLGRVAVARGRLRKPRPVRPYNRAFSREGDPMGVDRSVVGGDVAWGL